MPSAVVWMIDGGRCSERQLAPWLACLSDAERQRYQRFIRAARQREFLIGRILLRFAVARLTNLAFAAVTVIERQNNAPLLRLPETAASHPSVSLSHSRGWVACAVSADTPLGLDIEMHDASRDLMALSQAAFSALEHGWLSQQTEASRTAEFYALWSSKEALYKLMSNTDNQSAQPELAGAGGKLTSGVNWHLKQLSHPQLSIALCSLHPLSAPRLIELHGGSPFAWAQEADLLFQSRVEGWTDSEG
jgi:4'-phosphopantetheinyl transferase